MNDYTVKEWNESCVIEDEAGNMFDAVKGWNIEEGMNEYCIFITEDGSFQGGASILNGMAAEDYHPCEAFAKAVEFGLV